jgi:hypothetical protein
MSGIRKSTDAGLTNAERKSLRESEAQEAMSDHDAAEEAFHKNRERLRKARLAREATAGPMLYPVPDLPDDTPVGNVYFSKENPERDSSRGMEERPRNSRRFGRNAVKPARSWARVRRASSREAE